MPKVSVYLSDDLYRRAKEQALPLSTIAQEAIETALRRDSIAEWIERVRAMQPVTTTDIDTQAAMDEVRGEWGT